MSWMPRSTRTATVPHAVQRLIELSHAVEKLTICAIGPVTNLAAALVQIAVRLVEDPEAPVGAYHVVNRGETTWRRVAEAVFARAATHGRKAPSVIPMSTSEYPTPARRPLNSRLSTDRLERDYAIVLPDWRSSIERIVDQLLQAETSV